jgi:propanol-preferring alcohol dehydrogenase
MKALLIPGDGKVELVDVPTPSPGPGEVLVQVKRSGICGTDLQFLKDTNAQRDQGASIVPGHESAGVIAEIGEGVTARKVGERVIGYHHIGCGSCHYCRADLPTQCARKTVTGRTRHGSNAEYELLPEWAVFPLPEDFSFDEGVLLACNISTAFSALRKAGVDALKRICVFGQGVVGLSAVMLARGYGARIAAVDLSDARLSASKEFGAELALNAIRDEVVKELVAWSGGRGVDAVLECSGSGKAVRQALDALGPQGTLVFVGGGSPIEASSNELLGRELKLLGTSVYRPSELELMIDLIQSKRLPLQSLIERTFRPEEAAEAYALAARQDARKLLFSWN